MFRGSVHMHMVDIVDEGALAVEVGKDNTAHFVALQSHSLAEVLETVQLAELLVVDVDLEAGLVLNQFVSFGGKIDRGLLCEVGV